MTVFENDSAQAPYAQDLDEVWHRRPANDSWNSDQSATQCRTVCGQAIYSVHVSEYEPSDGLCPACSAV